MNNKEKIQLSLRTGEKITFQNPKNKRFMKVGGAGKDIDGNYRISASLNKKEKCDNYIGAYDGYTLDELLEYDFISNEPYSFGEPVPVGTKVEIIETGEILTIEKRLGGCYFMKEEFDKNYPNFYKCVYSRQSFRIHFEEEIELNDKNIISVLEEIKKCIKTGKTEKPKKVVGVEETEDGGLIITFRKI